MRVWDTSIYIDCLNGFPGPLIKWFHSRVGLDKICQIADSQRLSYRVVFKPLENLRDYLQGKKF